MLIQPNRQVKCGPRPRRQIFTLFSQNLNRFSLFRTFNMIILHTWLLLTFQTMHTLAFSSMGTMSANDHHQFPPRKVLVKRVPEKNPLVQDTLPTYSHHYDHHDHMMSVPMERPKVTRVFTNFFPGSTATIESAFKVNIPIPFCQFENAPCKSRKMTFSFSSSLEIYVVVDFWQRQATMRTFDILLPVFCAFLAGQQRAQGLQMSKREIAAAPKSLDVRLDAESLVPKSRKKRSVIFPTGSDLSFDVGLSIPISALSATSICYFWREKTVTVFISSLWWQRWNDTERWEKRPINESRRTLLATFT